MQYFGTPGCLHVQSGVAKKATLQPPFYWHDFNVYYPLFFHHLYLPNQLKQCTLCTYTPYYVAARTLCDLMNMQCSSHKYKFSRMIKTQNTNCIIDITHAYARDLIKEC